MGYRHYFLEISKSEIEKLKDMSPTELVEYMKETQPEKDFSWLPFYQIGNQKRVFEFGKLEYDNMEELIYGTASPFFDNQETQEYYSEYRPYIVGKEGLLKAIECYQNKIISYYRSILKEDETLITPFGIEVDREITKEQKWERHITSMLREWERGNAVDTNMNHEYITSSWKYEYETFELVRLLKAIDWENKTLLFYGW